MSSGGGSEETVKFATENSSKQSVEKRPEGKKGRFPRRERANTISGISTKKKSSRIKEVS